MKDFSSKNILYFVYFIYFIFILGIFYFSSFLNSANFINGYLLGNDSIRYIEGAKNILNFQMPDGKGTSYLGYIFFLIPFYYFNFDLSYVVCCQILLTFLSSLCLYKISIKFSSKSGALFCLCLYLFYLPLQIRNFYILTETLFICTIIFITYLLVFFKKKLSPILIFLIIFSILIRPHGILILPSILLSIFFWTIKNKKEKLSYLFLFISFISIYPFINLLNHFLENENIIDKIINQGIIYGYNNENNYLDFNKLNSTKNDFWELIKFLNNNLLVFFEAFYKKIFYFYLRVRPFYSDIHNLYLIAYSLISYPLAIYGMFKTRFNNNLGLYFVITLIMLLTLSIGMSFSDWSGRYSLYILPLIYFFSGCGFYHLVKAKLKWIEN